MSNLGQALIFSKIQGSNWRYYLVSIHPKPVYMKSGLLFFWGLILLCSTVYAQQNIQRFQAQNSVLHLVIRKDSAWAFSSTALEAFPIGNPGAIKKRIDLKAIGLPQALPEQMEVYGRDSLYFVYPRQIFRLNPNNTLQNLTPGSLPQGLQFKRIVADKKGRIWLGTTTGVYGLQNGTLSKVANLPEQEVNAMRYDPINDLILAILGITVYRLKDGNVRQLPIPQDPLTHFPQNIFQFGNDLVVGSSFFSGSTFGYKLNIVRRDTITPQEIDWTARGLAKEAVVYDLARGPRGEVFAASSAGYTVLTSEIGFYINPQISNNPLGSAFRFRVQDDIVMVATLGNGVQGIIGSFSQPVSYQSSNFPPGDGILGLFRTSTGTLYMYTPLGLYQQNGQQWQLLNLAPNSNARQPYIQAMTETSDNKLVLGTFNGLFYLNNGVLIPSNLNNRLDRKEIRSVSVGNDGKIWVGTGFEGLWQLSANDQVLSTNGQVAQFNGSVNQVQVDRRTGDVYCMGSLAYIIRVRNGIGERIYPEQTGVTLRGYTLSADGKIWVANSSGELLSSIDGKTWTKLELPNYPNSRINLNGLFLETNPLNNELWTSVNEGLLEIAADGKQFKLYPWADLVGIDPGQASDMFFASGNRITLATAGQGLIQFSINPLTASRDIPVSKDCFSLYPNPSADYVVLEHTNGQKNNQGLLRISDMQGRKMMELNLNASANRQEISLQKLPKGQYLVEQVQENRRCVGSFLKN
jgi:Secretion system C-terminal sorting domain